MSPILACLASLLSLSAQTTATAPIQVDVVVFEVNRTKLRAAPDEIKALFPGFEGVPGQPAIFGTILPPQGREDVLRRLQKLRERGIVRLLASPTISANQGQEARHEIGDHTFRVTATHDADQISLDLELDVTDIDPNGGRRGHRHSTTFDVVDGHSFLMGGFVTSIVVEPKVTKTPVLGSLPFVGHWFQTTVDEESEIEHGVLVTARLVRP